MANPQDKQEHLPGEDVSARKGDENILELLRESLNSARDYSRKLRFGLDSIAERIEAGDMDSALPRLSSAFDGISWLIGVYDRCRFFLAAPIRLNEETVVQEKLLEALKRLVAMAEKGDTDGAAWVMRNELMPRVRTLSLRIEELAKLRIAPQ